MRTRAGQAFHTTLEKHFPEKRLFLRSDTETRFIRLRPETQLLAWMGSCLLVGWAIVATAIVLMDSIGAGNFRAQAERDKMIYEERLSELSRERDARAAEARAAQERFNSALTQVSRMQMDLLRSEDHRRELETGLDVVHATLSRTMRARKALEDRLADMQGDPEAGAGAGADSAANSEMASTVDMLADTLAQTAAERDMMAADADFAIDRASELELELRLMEDRNDAIFRQLEEAMLVSVEPLENMFDAAGLDTDNLLAQVRRGYSGTGGPLMPLSFSTMGDVPNPQAERANRIIDSLDRINLYRIAAESAPFDMPVRSNYRLTSGYGMRWGRLHAGTDFAGPVGTPVYVTGEGVVTEAGWSSGYGRLIKIQHQFGLETRYAHLSRIRVEVGQRVSRGDRIGDMGNSGRSTGPHLHYEVRIGGEPVNPMTYIRAGRNVF